MASFNATLAAGGGVSLAMTLCGVIGCTARAPAVQPAHGQTAAVALYATEANVGARGETLRAIATARQIVLDDLRHAEVPGYKRRIATAGPSTRQPRVTLDLGEGKLKRTDRPLDVAIQGNGFLVVRWPAGGTGVAYTRCGTLFTDRDAQLVVGFPGGDAQAPLVPPIRVPADVTDITISEAGEVTILRTGQNAPQSIGQLELSQFPDPASLELARDGGVYLATPESGEARIIRPREASAGTLLQGFIEQSNVDPSVEQLRLEFLKRWEAALLAAE